MFFGLTDLATAASSLTAIMKAYGYTADEMREKSDMLFAAVMEGKFHAADLNEAIGKVLPTAAAMGVQIDEVVTALAVLTQRGLDVNEAATGLNRWLISILRPMDKAKKEFQKLGLAFGKNAFEGQGLVGMLEKLQTASVRYSDILPKIFRRQRALRVQFIFASGGLEDYKRLLLKVNKATEEGGEVNRAYGKIILTLGERLKAFHARLLQAGEASFKLKGFIVTLVDLFEVFGVGLLKEINTLGRLAIVLITLKVAFKAVAISASLVKGALERQAAATGAMSIRLHAFGVRLMSAAHLIRLASVALTAATIVYFVGASVVNKIKENIEKLNERLEEQKKRLEKVTEGFEFLKYVLESLHISVENLDKDIKVMTFMRVISEIDFMIGSGKTLSNLARDLAANIESRTNLFLGLIPRTNKKFEELSITFFKLLCAVKSGSVDVEEHHQALELLAKSLGITEKVLTENIEKWKENKAVGEVYTKFLLQYNFLMRDVNEAMGMMSKHAEEIAETTPAKALREMIERFEEILALPADAPFLRYLKDSGKDVDELKRNIIAFIPHLREALKVSPMVQFRLGVEDTMNTLMSGFDELYPGMEQIKILSTAVYRTWKEKWEAAGDTMEAYVKRNKKQIEILARNLDKVPAMYRDVIIEMAKHLDKGSSAEEKFRKKVEKAQGDFFTNYKKLINDIAVLENELRGERWNDIIIKTREENELMKKKLDEQYKVLKVFYGDAAWLFALYQHQIAAMKKKEELSDQVAVARRLQAYIQDLKEKLTAEKANSYERYRVRKQFFDNFDELMKEYGVKDEEQIKKLLRLAEDAWKAVETMAERALRGIGDAIGNFVGGVLLKMDSLENLWNTFWESLKKVALDVTSKIISEGIEKLAKEAVEAFAEIAAAGDAALVASLFIVFKIIEGWLKTFGIIKDEAEEAEEIVKTLTEEIADLYRHIESIFKWIFRIGWASEGMLAALEKDFADLIDKLIEAGQMGSKEWIVLVQKVRYFGLEIKSLNEYLLSELDKIPEALSVLIENLGGVGDRLEGLSEISVTTFNAMIASGRSYYEALRALDEPLTALRERYEELGLEIPENIRALLAMNEAMKLHPEVFQNLDAAIVILNSLRNAAYMTQGTFNALASTAEDAVKVILGVSGDLNEALKNMGQMTEDQINMIMPIVAQFTQVAALFGLAVPEWMQTFVSKQLGLDWKTFEDQVTKQAMAGIHTVERLDTIIELLGGGGRESPLARELRNVIDVVSRLDGYRERGGREMPGAQMGLPYIGQTQAVKVHRGESILPEDISSMLRSFYGKKEFVLPREEKGAGLVQVVLQVDGLTLYKALVPYLRKGGDYADYEVSGDGVF